MNVYRCLGETIYNPMGWGEPPEPGRDVGIVAARSRAQARHIFWRDVSSEDVLLTELRASIVKTGTIERDEPGVVEYPESEAYWLTPKELGECTEED